MCIHTKHTKLDSPKSLLIIFGIVYSSIKWNQFKYWFILIQCLGKRRTSHLSQSAHEYWQPFSLISSFVQTIKFFITCAHSLLEKMNLKLFKHVDVFVLPCAGLIILFMTRLIKYFKASFTARTAYIAPVQFST